MSIQRLAAFLIASPVALAACGVADPGDEETSRLSSPVCTEDGLDSTDECSSTGSPSGGDDGALRYPTYPPEEYAPNCGDGKKYICCESDARAHAREVIDWLRRDYTDEALLKAPEMLNQLWFEWSEMIDYRKAICGVVSQEWQLCRQGLVVPVFDCFNLPMPTWQANGGVDSGLPKPPTAPVQQKPSGGGSSDKPVDYAPCSPCSLGQSVSSSTCFGYCQGFWTGDGCYVNLC